jgi:hypothetical protein
MERIHQIEIDTLVRDGEGGRPVVVVVQVILVLSALSAVGHVDVLVGVGLHDGVFFVGGVGAVVGAA